MFLLFITFILFVLIVLLLRFRALAGGYNSQSFNPCDWKAHFRWRKGIGPSAVWRIANEGKQDMDNTPPYTINTDVKFGPLTRIDVNQIRQAVKEPWFNQTL